MNRKEHVMPLGIVKIRPGPSEQQKAQCADKIVEALVASLGTGEDSVSVAIEEVTSDAWMRSCTGPTSTRTWVRCTKNLTAAPSRHGKRLHCWRYRRHRFASGRPTRGARRPSRRPASPAGPSAHVGDVHGLGLAKTLATTRSTARLPHGPEVLALREPSGAQETVERARIGGIMLNIFNMKWWRR